MNKSRPIAALLLLILAISQVSFGFSDTSAHWASRYISEVRKTQLLTGFPDGTFRPDAAVTREQFIAVVVRTLPTVGLSDETITNDPTYWAKNYIAKAKEIGLLLPDEFGDESRATFAQPISRGEMFAVLARVVTALKLPLDEPLPLLKDWSTMNEARRAEAETVIRAGLIKGNSDGTIGVNMTMTRGQFATIIYRVLEEAKAIGALTTPDGQGYTDPSSAAVIGQAYRSDASQYTAMYRTNPNVRWYVFHTNYTNFSAVAVDNNDSVIALVNRQSYPLGSLTSTTLNNRIPQLYILPNSYLVNFHDHIGNQNIFFFEFVGNYSTFESTPENDAQCSDFEALALDLVNVIRVREGQQPLVFSQIAHDYCRSYSADMVARNFFSHTTPDGKTFKDRISQLGISYSSIGENLIYNYMTPFEMVYAWINSQGHRNNILNPAYTHGAIGIKVRNSDKYLYGTQLLYRVR